MQSVGGPINWAKSLGPHHTHTADIPGGEGTLKQAVTLVGALGQGSRAGCGEDVAQQVAVWNNQRDNSSYLF